MKQLIRLFPLALVAASSPDWPIAQPESWSPKLQPAFVDDLLAEAVRSCRLLNEFRLQVVSIKYDVRNTADTYQNRQYGWRTTLEVGFRLSEHAPIPSGLELAGPVGGDVMLFEFGGGRKPGIVVNKATSRFACGLPVDSGDDVFIPAPWMRAVDDPHIYTR